MDPIRSHDQLFRFVFREPEQMADLLRGCLPPALVDAIRWPTLRRLPDTFVDRLLSTRAGDLFFGVEVGDTTAVLQVLVEHKSKVDRCAALQQSSYTVRLLEGWLADHEPERSLPPVLTVVLYHGDEPWDEPTSVHELIDTRGIAPAARALLESVQLRQPFFLIDLSGFDEDRIDAVWRSAVTNLALRFVQLLRSLGFAEAMATMQRWRTLIAAVRAHPRGRDILEALCSWFFGRNPADPTALRTTMNKLDLDQEELPVRSMLDLLLEMGEERAIAKGREKWVQLGQRSGMGNLLLGQLQARFGDLSPAVTERIQEADAETLQRWSLRLLTATAIDDVLAG